MSLFENSSESSLFTPNVEALDFDYLPKLVPFRENEQRTVASCIKPLFQKRNGRNIFVHGTPGIGKTVAIKHLLKDLEEQTDEIHIIYVNCWQKNTSYKILLSICDQIGYKFTQNKKTEELVSVITNIVNKTSAVLVFDEIDKVVDLDFLYSLLEEIYRKTVVLITNFPSWLSDLDERIRSRLQPEVLEFKNYNENETIEILRERKKFAFVPNSWKDDAFIKIAKKAAELKDIRIGLSLLRVAGEHAESRNSNFIEVEDSDYALNSSIIPSKDKKIVEKEDDLIEIIKNNSGKKIGDLFTLYNKDISYKTFQRKIKKLEDNKTISVQKLEGGSEGNTSIIHYGQRSLKDF